MPRGFIKPVNGSMRMRFVKPGYNADDMATPEEHVIFDSEDLAVLSVVQAGEYDLGDGAQNGKTVQIATWNLDFVPLCAFQYSFDGSLFGPSAAVLTNGNGDFNSFYTRVSSTGIVVSYRMATSAARLRVRYTAFDLPVF